MTPEQRASAWVAHLETGGTTTWEAFAPEAPGEPLARGLPGAQQLELTRRANLVGAPPTLRRRILDAGLTGRGLQDLPLSGLPARGYAARPTDPADLEPFELSRVAVGVLADQLVELGPAAPARVVGRTRGPAYTLGGDPLLCEDVGRQLRRAGRHPGGWRARTFVLGDRLDLMLAHAWLERCFTLTPPEWAEWVGGLAQDDQLPPRADLAEVARRRSRTARVELAFDLDALGRRLRLPLSPPRVLGHEAGELVRRVAVLLGLLAPEQGARLLRSRLVPALPSGGTPLLVAAEHHAWLQRRAHRVAAGLDGYPCHGDRGLLTAAPEDGTGDPDETVLVAAAIAAMVALEEVR